MFTRQGQGPVALARRARRRSEGPSSEFKWPSCGFRTMDGIVNDARDASTRAVLRSLVFLARPLGEMLGFTSSDVADNCCRKSTDADRQPQPAAATTATATAY